MWAKQLDRSGLGFVLTSRFSRTARYRCGNVGLSRCIFGEPQVLIGAKTGLGPIYKLKFIATAPDGMELEGVHFTGFAGVAGVLVPFSVRLNAGETHELEFPLTDIIYILRASVRLDALVKVVLD